MTLRQLCSVDIFERQPVNKKIKVFAVQSSKTSKTTKTNRTTFFELENF